MDVTQVLRSNRFILTEDKLPVESTQPLAFRHKDYIGVLDQDGRLWMGPGNFPIKEYDFVEVPAKIILQCLALQAA
ncbi:MAG: hypothetical protein AAB449_00945 [Patescibacteria group bacterium]